MLCNRNDLTIRTFVFLPQILKGQKSLDGRPGESLPPVDFEKLKADLAEKHGHDVKERHVISAALYPKVTDDFLEFHDKYGPVDRLDTKIFFVGPKVAQEMEVCYVFDSFLFEKIMFLKASILKKMFFFLMK